MYKIEVVYQLSNSVEIDSCNKVTSKITFHPSFKTFYYPYMCVDGVIKIVEQWLMF